MKKRWTLTFLALFVVLSCGVFLSSIYLKDIGIHNVRIMYTLRTTDSMIVPMGMGEGGHGIYLTKLNHPAEVVKERMNEEGWRFIQQEGSGYFFEKGNRKAVITTQIWHRYFVKMVVQDNVVNIADKK